MKKPLVLITNDDGVLAPGIRAIADALSDFAEVVIAAPDRERSAASHSISLDRPLRYFLAKRLRRFRRHQGRVFGANFLRDGKCLVSTHHDETVCRWDLATGKEVRRWEVAGKIRKFGSRYYGIRLVASNIAQLQPRRKLR